MDEESYELFPVKDLRALEMVFPNHLNNLEKMMIKDGMIKTPIIAESKHKIVLDGSHRHVILAMLGYKNAPVVFVDYNNPLVTVGSNLIHRFVDDRKIRVTKEEVIIRALTGKLYPPRTTRHFFPFRKPSVFIPLMNLERANPINMSSHIARVTISDEVRANKGYVAEIDAEKKFIQDYCAEQAKVRAYLLKQVKMMERG